MARSIKLIVLICAVFAYAEDFGDFDFEGDADEVMIAQESRHYQTVVQPQVRIIKPSGVTNSHRPQYNLDSLEIGDIEDLLEANSRRSLVKNYRSSTSLRGKETVAKDAVFRAIERKDQIGKFAQILPIIRAMTPTQRHALASLVANQVTTPPGRAPLTLLQVRSMFSNTDNTTEQMLPIILDMANLVRKATGPGKETRHITHHPQLIRRSIDDVETEPFDVGVEPAHNQIHNKQNIRRVTQKQTNTTDNTVVYNTTKLFGASEVSSSPKTKPVNTLNTSKLVENTTPDLMADSTNTTVAQNLPVAEKLIGINNRYIDRKGSLIRRGTYPPKPYPTTTRRTTVEPTVSPVTRRRPTPPRKLIVNTEQSKCELFTNTLCLHTEDYPTDAIVQSIRRNKAAAGALLADFKDPGEGALDGVTPDQESKYTADHYLVSNRRGDTANRDFAGAGEAGFMCPSTVKYARPQRARATSGQWKYIVNTGEHTQTLRLEKCLKPKESCTYLTDNFKSKCVQVYNYHRLLTWDQQNGLHMDIFKVPTCCSCHIEGYSVSFPPLGHRIHETSSEHFPGEDLSSEHGNHAFEAVQSTIQRPVSKTPPYSIKKPETFPPFSDNSPNLIPGTPFSKGNLNDNEESDSDPYSSSYFPDSFNQPSNPMKNIRRPPSARSPSNNVNYVTLPSYLEPPTPSAGNTFTFNNDPPNMPPKFKTSSQFKRGTFRPTRRPLRKKISGPEDLVSAGSAAIESAPNGNYDTVEDLNDFIDEPQIGQASSIDTKTRITITPKLHAATTEKSSTVKSKEKNVVVDNFTSNGKKINYNYHPIIDFFGENEKEADNTSIDREDLIPHFVPPADSEWKPINTPPRNMPNTKISSRIKQ